MLREGSAPLIRREDYSAPAFWVREVELTFDLDGAKTLVASKLRIERNATQPAQPLRLHGDGLTLLRVMADGQSVSFRHEADGSLVIDNTRSSSRSAIPARPTRTPSFRACTRRDRACSRSARPKGSVASPTSSTGRM